MSVGRDVIPRRVPCILRSPDQEGRLYWREVFLTSDEIRDAKAAPTRSLIAYGMLLVLPSMQYQTDETCHNQGFLQRPTD